MKTFSITDVGMVREVNQDYVFCYENPIGQVSNLFLVADGMGGHKAGDYASRYWVEKVVESIKNGTIRSPISIMERAIQEANAAVYSKAESEETLNGMGTTIVAATILGSELYIANVGDSRAYLIREGIHQITEDHSLVEAMIQSGDIDRKDARLHPNKNVITRAIGTSATVQADFFEISVEEGDVLLICTDGLTNMIEDDEICQIIKRDTDLKKVGTELVRVANANGGRDNIGIVLVQI